MAHNLAVTFFILIVYVAATATTPFVCATKSSASTTTEEHEATKDGDAAAKAPEEVATKGYAKDDGPDAKGDVLAKAPDATIKGSTKDEHEADAKGDALAKASESATKGYAKVPNANTKGASAKGPKAPMSWPDGGPQMVEMVIKNPFLKTTPPSNSDGLPIDPTPEGSMT